MNMAARMEQTSRPGWIQVSHTTAEVLKNSGKENWLRERGGVEIKGKGSATTYWLDITGTKTMSRQSSTFHDPDDAIPRRSLAHVGRCSSLLTDRSTHDDRVDRLVDWNVDILTRLLKQIHGRRLQRGDTGRRGKLSRRMSSRMLLTLDEENQKTSVLDEVSEIIMLPQFDKKYNGVVDIASIKLDPSVEKELRDFVYTIAMMYRDNAFHNFEVR
jgi:hypothetical protein